MIQTQNKIMALVNAGQFQDARHECQLACDNNPQNAQLWFMLSAICGQMKDFPAAEQSCRKSLELNGASPQLLYNLAVAQRGQGHTDDAYRSLQEAVQLQSNFTAAFYEMGNICLEKENYAGAIDFYQKVIKDAPEAFQAHAGLAIAQQKSGDDKAAISASLESLRINPVQQDVSLRLATLYDALGKAEDAIQYYNRSIELGYAQADVYINIGRMFAVQGQQNEADNAYQRALKIDPDSVEALSNLAVLHDEMRDTENALKYIKKAYQLAPLDERVGFNYAKVLASSCQYDKAETQYEKLLDKNPDFIDAAVNLGNLYLLSGRAYKAQETYSHACHLKPVNHEAGSNMLMSLNYTSQHSDIDIFERHTLWAKQIEEGVQRLSSTDTKNTKTILKIGYVSPDFKDHSVAYFIEGILRHSDKEVIENYCYSDVINKDLVTKRIKAFSDHWRDVSRLDDSALAELIQQDEIDILVDLCGHMSGNRMPMFALKPASVQITYLGYPNTTGLSAMDYRIVDNTTDPEGSERLMSEAPLRIEPCFLSYTPLENSPDVAELPALKNRCVTFGSFNNLAKMSDEVFDTWSKILLRVPGSRLCVKARQFSDTALKDQIIKKFTAAGIDETRLELLSYSTSTTEHLQMYSRIDIALDTFPYNGTTTTFEALWMGLPVVCLNGSRHASRVGTSILQTLGYEELLAENTLEYIDVAANLAADINRLQGYREQLRSQMQNSSLLDVQAFTEKFESILTGIHSK